MAAAAAVPDAGRVGLRPDGAYWAALPVHICNFIRTASFSPQLRAADGNKRAKVQAMYVIAQQMAQMGEQGSEGQVPSQAVGGMASERDISSLAAAELVVDAVANNAKLTDDPIIVVEWEYS